MRTIECAMVRPLQLNCVELLPSNHVPPNGISSRMIQISYRNGWCHSWDSQSKHFVDKRNCRDNGVNPIHCHTIVSDRCQWIYSDSLQNIMNPWVPESKLNLFTPTTITRWKWVQRLAYAILSENAHIHLESECRKHSEDTENKQ